MSKSSECGKQRESVVFYVICVCVLRKCVGYPAEQQQGQKRAKSKKSKYDRWVAKSKE